MKPRVYVQRTISTDTYRVYTAETGDVPALVLDRADAVRLASDLMELSASGAGVDRSTSSAVMAHWEPCPLCRLRSDTTNVMVPCPCCGGLGKTLVEDSQAAGVDRQAPQPWQSIETSPKETPVLVVDETHSRDPRVIGAQLTKHGEWLSVPGRYSLNATAWQPMPPLPEKQRFGIEFARELLKPSAGVGGAPPPEGE